MTNIMKKIIPIFIILLIVLCIPNVEYAIEVSRITMDKDSIVIDEGQSEQLTVTLFPNNGRNKKITWESTDEEIASVDRTGKVTGNKKGVTIVTATTSNRKMTRCRVQVIKREEVEITSLKLNQNKLNIVKGQTASLSLKVEPENAKGIDSLIWSISDESIVTEKTRTMNKPLSKEFEALSRGVATITVSTPDGKYKDSATITVLDNDISSLSISKTYLSMNAGESTKIEINWSPSTSTIIPDIDFVLSKDGIISYKVESTNNEKSIVSIKAEKIGRTKLSATVLGRKVSCDIVVLSSEIEVKGIKLNTDKAKIKVGEGIQLTASIIPENATKLPEKFLWSVSNDRMEQVMIGDDSNELQYTTSFIAKKAGIATIIVKIPGTSMSSHCVVTIEEGDIEVTSIAIDKKDIDLKIGDTDTLNVKIEPENATNKSIIWKSTNEDIVDVDENGKITAKSEGIAVISALTVNGKISTCVVRVKSSIVPVSNITLDKSYITLDVNQEETLVATIEPEDAADKKITWSSSNENIVTVNEGKVIGKNKGTAIITATSSNGLKASCIVTIQAIEVESIELDKTKLDMTIGQSATIKAVIKPDDATNKNIMWSTSDSEVVEVKEGIVKAKKIGTATITALTPNGKSASCTINVSGIPVSNIKLNKTSLTLNKGQSDTLSVSIEPENATDKKVTWSSSDSNIVEVNNSGKISAKNVGKAIITVTSSNGLKASCTITVQEPIIDVTSIKLNKSSIELTIGKSETLKATIEPSNASNKTITWKSSDSSVAEVKNGVVTAKKAGSATITATSSNGKSATCKVTVKGIDVTSIKLNKSSITLNVGKSETLKATIEPSSATNKTIKWKSSDSSIVDVNNGVITAKKVGSATITASTSNGKSATCKVTVKGVDVSSIKLNKSSIELTIGKSETLKATIEPSNATNKNITWKSSDSSIAEVKNGVVTAKKTGSVTITASSSNGKSATCKVTVKGVDVSSIKLNKTSIELTIGKSETLKATIEPSNASNKTITWKSSDSSKAEVKNGVVTAKKAGSATITATSSNGKTATCKVTVKGIDVTSIKLNKSSMELAEGKSETLKVTIEPSNASNKTITWKSSNTSVATVKDSKVTAKKAGSATITATSSNGKTATCKVTVKSTSVAVTGITLKQKDRTINVGATLQIEATITPSNATNKTITWSSSNTKVATVSKSGLVKGITAGKVTITAKTNNNKSATCIIRVSVPAKSISLNKKSISMSVGSTEKLTVTFNPTNTSSKEITWTTSNKSVATVSSSGVVTAKAKGNATITATSKYGKTATCTVTVNDKVLYVSKKGSDSNNGKTSNTAFKTIKKGLSKLSAGYKLVIAEGTYSEHNLKIKMKGTTSEPIKIVGNGNVKIDGSGKDLILKISGSENIVIEGIKFQNLNKDNSYGILIEPKCKNITISNCKFENIKTPHPKGEEDGSSAIYVNGTSTTAIDNITIKNCSLYNIQAGYSEAISIDGNCTYITITGVSVNYSGMKGNIGICVCGHYRTCKDKPELDRPRHVTISNCTVKNCKSPYRDSDDGFAYGIYVDGGEDVKIFNNVVENCEGGIEVGAEEKAKASSLRGKETENIEVYNNTVSNCEVGMQIGGWDGKACVYKCKVNNNTFKNCGHNGGRTMEISRCNHVSITNNKFSTKESKTYEYTKKSEYVKNLTKSGNTYGK